jgi:ferredoxin
MKKRFVSLVLTLGLCVSFLTCPASAQEMSLTPKNPIKVDTRERSVSVLAQVNGKYLTRSTRHGMVFREGKNGRKAIFAAFADPKSFYEGLVSAGFKPGNNMTMENKEKTFVEGEALDASVTWKGAKKTYRMDEAIKDSNGKPLAIRFAGNLVPALEMKVGCLMCLDSCPVGITGNATYTYGAVEGRKEVSFTGNKDILPPDGTLVIITFKAKK